MFFRYDGKGNRMAGKLILGFALSALLLLVGVVSSKASEPLAGDTQEVIASGTGHNAEAALGNAYRNAVSQVVGALVIGEILVQNDQIIRDRILTLSNGFVHSYDLLGQNTLDDGLVEIRIRARVKRNDVTSHLQQAGVIQLPVDVRGLAAERRTREMTFDDAFAIFEELMEGYPAKLLDISLTSTPVYDRETGQTVIEFAIQLNGGKYAEFTRQLNAILPGLGAVPSGASTIQATFRTGKTNCSTTTKPHVCTLTGVNTRLENRLFIADKWPSFSRDGQQSSILFQVYTLPKDTFGMMAPFFKAVFYPARIEITDKGGAPIYSTKFDISPPSNIMSYLNEQNAISFSNHNQYSSIKWFPIAIFPTFTDFVRYPNGSYHFFIGQPKLTKSLSINLSLQDMERMSDTILVRWD